MKNFIKLKDRPFTELLHCFSSAAYGKSKNIDCLYLIRQTHQKRTKLPGVLEWIKSKNWEEAHNIFISTITNIIAKKNDLDQPSAKKIITDIFDIY